jgi:hypothetical protein
MSVEGVPGNQLTSCALSAFFTSKLTVKSTLAAMGESSRLEANVHER